MSTKPNFSGEYALDRASSVLSANAAAMVTAVLRIAHDDPRCHCSASFASANDTIEFTFDRVTDGRETSVSANESSRCYWDGDALVTEDRMGPGETAMVMTWRYELSDDGRRLRASERIVGAGRDQENVWEFKRQ